MGFNIKDWKDYPDTSTPITQAALEDMETRLSTYTDTAIAARLVNVKDYGATGDGSTNDSTAVENAIAAAAAKTYGGTVYFPAGRYMLKHDLAVSAGVSLLGEGMNSTYLVCRDTAGGAFITVRGSHVSVRNLTVDNRRSTQTAGTGGGAISVVKADTSGAGSTTFSGAMILSGSVSAGATSLSVSSGAPALPGEMVTLVEGVKSERVRVAPSHTAGSNTITLYHPTVNSYTTAAYVAACPTNVVVDGCRVYGGQRDCVFFYNAAGCRATNNYLLDCADTALDLPNGGFGNVFANNVIESNGRWCIALDGGITYFPRQSHAIISGNHVRLVGGGSDASGQAVDAIYVGTVDNTTITANTIDMREVRKADIGGTGITGVRIIDATNTAIVANTITGIRDDTRTDRMTGIRINPSSGNEDVRCRVSGNVIKSMDYGIRFETGKYAVVDNNNIYDIYLYAIDFERHATIVQDFIALGNQIDGCLVGIRGGGSTGAASTLKTGLNSIHNASYANIDSDSGWTTTSISGFA